MFIVCSSDMARCLWRRFHSPIAERQGGPRRAIGITNPLPWPWRGRATDISIGGRILWWETLIEHDKPTNAVTVPWSKIWHRDCPSTTNMWKLAYPASTTKAHCSPRAPSRLGI